MRVVVERRQQIGVMRALPHGGRCRPRFCSKARWWPSSASAAESSLAWRLRIGVEHLGREFPRSSSRCRPDRIDLARRNGGRSGDDVRAGRIRRAASPRGGATDGLRWPGARAADGLPSPGDRGAHDADRTDEAARRNHGDQRVERVAKPRLRAGQRRVGKEHRDDADRRSRPSRFGRPSAARAVPSHEQGIPAPTRPG